MIQDQDIEANRISPVDMPGIYNTARSNRLIDGDSLLKVASTAPVFVGAINVCMAMLPDPRPFFTLYEVPTPSMICTIIEPVQENFGDRDLAPLSGRRSTT